MRAKRAEDKHSKRSKQAMMKTGTDSGDFLFSSSPYIDKKRVEEAMFRSPNKVIRWCARVNCVVVVQLDSVCIINGDDIDQ